MSARVSNYRNKLRQARVRRAAVDIVTITDLGELAGSREEYLTIAVLTSGKEVRSTYKHHMLTPLSQAATRRLEKLAMDLRPHGVTMEKLAAYVDKIELQRWA